MVYRGKPSGGCAICRKRKIKCDQATPQCGQCQRSGKTCPGYRNIDDLQFVDETDHVVSKSRVKHDTAEIASSSTNNPELVVGHTITEIATNETIIESTPRQVTPHLFDLAFGFFNANFILPGYLTLIENINDSQGLNPMTRAAVLSVGTAGLAHQYQSNHTMQQALSIYGQALRMTNEALRDPNTFKLDQTLISVVLMGVFETLTCNNLKAIVSWQTHIKGSSTLIALRGHEQFESVVGTMIFQYVRRLVLLLCLWNETPCDPLIIQWSKSYAFRLDQRQIEGLTLDEIGFKIAEFRYALRTSHLHDPHQVMAGGLELDAQLVDWANRTVENSNFSTIVDPDSDPSEIWNSRYHVYTGKSPAGSWSTWRGRALRINLNRLLNLCLAGMGKPVDSPERVRVNRTLLELTDEICYSHPWRIGSHAIKHYSRNSRLNSVGGAYSAFFTLVTAAEVLCEEPTSSLFSCSDSDIEKFSAAMRRSALQVNWLIGQLNSLSWNKGLKQAGVFAAMMRIKWNTHVALEKEFYNSFPLLEAFQRAFELHRTDPLEMVLTEEESFAVANHVRASFQRLSYFK